MTKPPYSKPFLTFEEQAKLLEDRGLALVTDENRQSLINLLRNLNFHRLEGYCLRYYRQEPKQHRFKPEASFARIQADYHADKRIRIETFDMIQNFEISLRSQIANVLGARYGAFPYNAEYYHSTKEEWDKMMLPEALEICKQSKSFHILNCESLESIEIDQYSFSDFAGDFELKNLPQLQSIQIGTVRTIRTMGIMGIIEAIAAIAATANNSYNFYSSSFVIRGIDVILNIVMIRSSKSTIHYIGK